MNRVYVSIDWGGTHLNAVLINSNGIAKNFELPSCNLKLGTDENLLNICKSALKEISINDDSELILLIGAAGVSNDKTADRLINTFKSLTNSIKDIYVYPDFLCNHAAFLNGEDGILSINGTGSILFGVKGEKQIRLGGWGYLFDETPSGAYFGKKYLEAVLKGMEGSTDHKYFLSDYISKYNFIEREELLNQIYFSSSIQNYMGNYAKDLIFAYEANVPYAKTVIDESVEKLAKSISEMINTLELKNPKFCGSGGLWSNWKKLKELLNVSCEKQGVQLIWQSTNNSLCLGPLLYYSRSHDDVLDMIKHLS